VAKTFNRLSQYNGLESKNRLTGTPLPLSSDAYTVYEWKIDEDILYPSGVNNLILKVSNSYLPSIGDPIKIVDISASDLTGYLPTATDSNPAALNDTYNIVDVNESGGYYYIHVETELSWSMGELTSSSTNSVVYYPYQHQWVCTGGTISTISEIYSNASRYSIKINPSGTGPVTLKLLAKSPMLLGDNGKDFSFNGKIYSTQQINVSCTLVYSEWVGIENTEPIFSTIYPGRFAAFRSNVEMLPLSEEETYNFDITITITSHGGKVVYFTSPHLIEDFLYYSNRYVGDSLNLMPNFYWEIDSAQTNPSAPLHRLIDCMMTGARDVYEEFLRIYHYEPGQLSTLSDQYTTNETHSTLVNPQYVESKNAPWLSQFNGHRLKKNIKYFYNGLTEETSTTPQNMFTSPGAIDSFVKWQLSTGYYGRAAGTTDAIREATKQVLHFTKDGEASTYFVSITPQYDSDPFKILIQTLLNETFDCQEDGEESYAILDAVEMAKPMGFKIYHRAVENVEFRVGDRLSGLGFTGNPIGSTADGIYPLGNVVPNDITGTPATGIVVFSVTSAAFTMLAGNTSATITLTGGTFKAGTIVAGDFTFAGTDATALAAGIFTRTGNAVVTITGLSGLVGTDNTVLVKAATQATQATAVVGAGIT